MITVTFIRHGQSEDNVKNIWAGWKDAPLSEHGRKQANALGQSLSSTRITHIYASPLLRAYATAQYVQHYQPDPKPPVVTNAHLREQYFGIAEGHPWMLQQPDDVTVEELYEQKIFPVLFGRDAKFPEAESLNELAQRTDIAIRECVLPHLVQHPEKDQTGVQEGGSEQGSGGVHVAIASHGLCIAELISSLLKLDPYAQKMSRFTGLSNTAWTRVNVRIREGHQGPIDPSNPPPLEVTVTHTKERDHLKSVNDIPHVELDAASVEARAFFGGESVPPLK